jgi:tetratricopeptide (TPR) repeat protein
LEPGHAQALAGRAQALLARNDPDGAIADFSAALQHAPTAAAGVPYLIGRGHARLVKKQPDEAIADLNQAVTLNPKSANAYNNRGLAYSMKGNLQEAASDYTAAITLNPVYAQAYANRGYINEKMDRRIDAAEDFNRALLLDRSLTGAAEGLKRIKAPGSLTADSDALVAKGRALVDANCSRCHAVGPEGTSPNEKAPEFRNLGRRHPVLALREPLTRGIAAPHDEMPKFALTDAEIDTIVAHINALTSAARK